jgi:hypothetical protein
VVDKRWPGRAVRPGNVSFREIENIEQRCLMRVSTEEIGVSDRHWRRLSPLPTDDTPVALACRQWDWGINLIIQSSQARDRHLFSGLLRAIGTTPSLLSRGSQANIHFAVRDREAGEPIVVRLGGTCRRFL